MSYTTITQTKHFSWLSQPKLGTVFCLLLILSFGFHLRYKAANHEYISQWDEAYHALVAKNFISHPLTPTLHDVPLMGYNYKAWGHNYIWLHKPPLSLWLMGLAIKIGGEQEIVFRLPSVLLATLSILLTYLIGKELLGRITGIFAAAFHAINPLFIRLVSGTIPTDHVDVALSFFLQASFLLLVVSARRRSLRLTIFSGLLLGCAILTKSLPALIVLTAMPLFWKGEKPFKDTTKVLLVVLLAASGVVLPWKIYTALSWPQESAWESHYTIKHISEVIEGHAHPANWYLTLIPEHYSGLSSAGAQIVTYTIITISIIFSVYCCLKKKDKALLSLLLWALVPYVLFSLTRTKLTAYVAIGVPAVLLLVGYSMASFLTFFSQTLTRKGRISSQVATFASACLISACFIPLGIDRVAADYSVCPWNNLYCYQIFRSKMMDIKKTKGQKIILNVGDNKNIQAMYYTGSPAYPNVPSPADLISIIKKGYQPYILTDSRHRNLNKIQMLLTNADLKGKLKMVAIP